MPWFWSDQIAADLTSSGKISEQVALQFVTRPVAWKVEAESVDDAFDQLLGDDEIPLAA